MGLWYQFKNVHASKTNLFTSSPFRDEPSITISQYSFTIRTMLVVVVGFINNELYYNLPRRLAPSIRTISPFIIVFSIKWQASIAYSEAWPIRSGKMASLRILALALGGVFAVMLVSNRIEWGMRILMMKDEDDDPYQRDLVQWT